LEQDLGAPPPAPLDQQPDSERRLQGEDQQHRQHELAMLLPQTRLTEPDVAPGRQGAFADSETLQLPPVEHRLDEIALRDGNVRGPSATEDAKDDPRGLLTDQDRVGNKAAGAAMTDRGFDIDHDRPVGRLGDRGETLVRKVRDAGAVDIDGRMYDRRV